MDFMFNATLKHHLKHKKLYSPKFSYLQNKLLPENVTQTPPEPQCLNCRNKNYAQILFPWVLTSALRCSQASAVYEASTSPTEPSSPAQFLQKHMM